LEAAFKSAQAKYKIAKDDYERSKQLYSEKMVSPQQFEAAASAFEVASAALDTAKVQYENTVIKSPISGKVLVKAIEKGELATVGSSIVTLADLSEVNLTVYLAEKDIGKIMLGEEVLVSVDSFPDEKFKGKVVFISEKAEFTPKAIQTKDERITQVFGIKIKIPNPEMKLKPGMPADAEF
jgi:HlyD family secretion protein